MKHLLRSTVFRASVRVATGLALVTCLWVAAPAGAQPADPHAAPAQAAQPAAPDHAPADASHPQADAHATPADAGHGAAAAHEGEHHEESLFSFLSRIANFLLLAGGLYYLLRSPLATYLSSRADQIRSDLVQAAQTRERASTDLQEIEARMRALPAEVDALKARGTQEVAAEQQRIRAAAATERDRLLEQARREIDQQLQGARRALKREVADLAVGIARLRVTHEITDQDRARLLDRYVAQVKAAHE